MDKGAIKTFAIEARKILMKSAATQAGFYGVTKDGCTNPIQKGAGFEVYRTIAGTENRIYGNDINRRRKLKEAVESQGFDQVIEETAYTWFNRLIAIRFMEVNGYLPTRTRVLSSETGSNTPDLVAQYLDVDLGMSDEEIEKVAGSIKDNRYDDAFALLFVKQCNALNELLPKLFEKTDDYMELLLKLSYTSDGVVRMLVDSIPESNFNVEEEGQVEIIGWLYQYYNSELKDDTFAKLKNNVKITKERIPAATQLFTPDWIVRYMVENSVGRLWIDGHDDNDLKSNWIYYLDDSKQKQKVANDILLVQKQHAELLPEDIKVIDPCMGSGHILVYVFDVLMQIYESQGYATRDIPQLILENNLFGLDIDNRATQLSYFSIMMKACQYNRRFLRKGVQPKVFSVQESTSINCDHLGLLGDHFTGDERAKILLQLRKLIKLFNNAKEYGSLLTVDEFEWDNLSEFVADTNNEGQLTLDSVGLEITQGKLNDIIKIGQVLSQKYDVVVTNPPYMGNSNMSTTLSEYVKQSYPDSKTDLYSVFVERMIPMVKENGLLGLMTSYTWMFLTSFEKFRKKLLNGVSLLSLVQPEYHSFFESANVPICTFILRNMQADYCGCYIKLEDFYGADKQAKYLLEAINNEECSYKYYTSHGEFLKIPGNPIAYWMQSSSFDLFNGDELLAKYADLKQGLITGDNNRFLRLWQECDKGKITINEKEKKKWFFYHKGGDYRKWYGNIQLVVNWENDGDEIVNFRDDKGKQKSRPQNVRYYLREGFTWTALTIADFNVRYMPAGSIFDAKGSSGFCHDSRYLNYIIGLCNSKPAMEYLSFLAPTMDYNAGAVAKLPTVINDQYMDEINSLVSENIQLCKEDWDSYEESWDFRQHPLVAIAEREQTHNVRLNDCFRKWEEKCKLRFDTLMRNEKRLNELYIDAYDMEDSLSPEVDPKNISIRKADCQREVKSLISYAVGCMFGRYSLNKTGLIFAGDNWRDDYYSDFIPDRDNCIPITDEEYFEDDIVSLFVNFIRSTFGEDYLEENLEYIAENLGNKGNTSREILRKYFLEDFFKNHCSIYSMTSIGKRPIYWLFDSGKQNGFKCLIYMHRYDKDTVGRVRSDYLRKAQDAIEGALKNAEYTIANSTSAVDKAAATKKREKYIKQLNETRTYFQALSHVALQRIEIDLDDGVKTNYAKFQGIEIVDENGKKQKIDLLAKI